MKTTVYVPCPHCNIVNERAVEITAIIMPLEIWHCDCEQGGCEKPFAVRLMASPQARTAKIGDEIILGEVWNKKESSQ